MRTYLSELGCRPVSAMVHIPQAQEVRERDGTFAQDVDARRWSGYFGRTFQQLAWWGAAAKTQQRVSSPTGPFNRGPSQRNAP